MKHFSKSPGKSQLKKTSYNKKKLHFEDFANGFENHCRRLKTAQIIKEDKEYLYNHQYHHSKSYYEGFYFFYNIV